MPSGQVSVWVPVVVGVLGVVGVIAAQLVAAWREDRRWRREAEREDLRWRREAEREDLRWTREKDRDVQNHWRDKRTNVYLELIEVLQAWDRHGREICERGADLEQQDPASLLREVENRSDNATATLTLLGSPTIARDFRSLQERYRTLCKELVSAGADGRKTDLDYLAISSALLTVQIRDDLDIEPIAKERDHRAMVEY